MSTIKSLMKLPVSGLANRSQMRIYALRAQGRYHLPGSACSSRLGSDGYLLRAVKLATAASNMCSKCAKVSELVFWTPAYAAGMLLSVDQLLDIRKALLSHLEALGKARPRTAQDVFVEVSSAISFLDSARLERISPFEPKGRILEEAYWRQQVIIERPNSLRKVEAYLGWHPDLTDAFEVALASLATGAFELPPGRLFENTAQAALSQLPALMSVQANLEMSRLRDSLVSTMVSSGVTVLVHYDDFNPRYGSQGADTALMMMCSKPRPGFALIPLPVFEFLGQPFDSSVELVDASPRVVETTICLFDPSSSAYPSLKDAHLAALALESSPA